MLTPPPHSLGEDLDLVLAPILQAIHRIAVCGGLITAAQFGL